MEADRVASQLEGAAADIPVRVWKEARRKRGEERREEMKRKERRVEKRTTRGRGGRGGERGVVG
eukprot:3424838-Rhodomonas_salina.1